MSNKDIDSLIKNKALGSDQFTKLLIDCRGNIKSKYFKELNALNWVIKHYNFSYSNIEYECCDELQKKPDFQLTLSDKSKVIIECTTAPRFTKQQMFDTLLKKELDLDERITKLIETGLSLYWNESTQLEDKSKKEMYKSLTRKYLNIIYSKVNHSALQVQSL